MRTLFLLSLSALVACRSTVSTTSFSWEAYEAELMQKNKIERLQALYSGVFLLCDSTGATMNTSANDSLLIWVRPAGDPNRDGYWIYQEQLMYNFPEKPIIADFAKITKLDEDSLRVSLTEVPGKTDIEGKGAFLHPELLSTVSLKQAKTPEDDCPMVFVRIGQLEYVGETPLCEDIEAGVRQRLGVRLTPRYMEMSFKVWNSETGEQLLDDTQRYRRLDEAAFRRQFPYFGSDKKKGS